MVIGSNMKRSKDMRIAVVCSSNQNRSMEAHSFLSKRGFNVHSYGTGSHVKLPGSSADKPNIYPFKTPYDHMYRELARKDPQLYKQNGILHMLDRNRRIKAHPERFQDEHDLEFDIIITAEERVYDQVLEEFSRRDPESHTPVHVINIDIQDNHEEATIGAFLICDMCEKLERLEDLDDDIVDVLQQFEKKAKRHILHNVSFY
ncbi:RNA polymerase II subunit A C-terminal domain phosphatase SSU72-like isoform X2 [Hydractinia symbiolongicarpus]|uniref:RNA polymerase II subunit A C-terminal domain phosphatase SSU72-like isoform X2 n=1 Tax=Hydractinia symbiolongicarpus TaxID=13093 RepID=UPI00254A4351|nr:RNA polymerase II subunit A C-terminal domain phosphatase SSU72-like isoform X2 [Hydractinia symbiolongicarpus]